MKLNIVVSSRSAAKISDFINDEDGQAAVEYVLIACALIIACYGAINMIVYAWENKFNKTKLLRSGPLP